MQEVYFLARHTPFWSIPLLVLGAEFSYMFWLKKKKRKALASALVALIGISATSFYVWHGGPEKTVKYIKKMQRENKN